ncbi:MAG: TonB-dependent receptor [Bacteroidia bacterium]|jgi:iron complex outermembrane receptor protein|nr:TonB-dependent receptor [Bacteroidia bacterium]
MFKKLALVYILIHAFYLFNAQNCNLRLEGIVRDEDNSESLAFSIVKLLSPEKILQCNQHGHFTIENLCAGNYKLLVQHLGCRDTVFEFVLKKSRQMVFKLPHSQNELQSIDIITKHEELKFTQSAQELDTKMMDKSRGLSLGDQLKQLNGVSTFNTGPSISKPMINGMQGYRILILNNGIRLEGQQWGSDHAPEIDPFIANKISLIRGASSVRYGSDAIGGIVLIDSGELPDTASVTGEFNLSGFSNGKGGAGSLQLQGYFDNVKNLSWRVQGSMKKTGNLKTPEYYLKNTGLEEFNFSYALEYHIRQVGFKVFYSQFNSRIGIFSNAHVGNLTDLQAAFNRNKPLDSLAGFSYSIDRPYQNIEHEMLKISSDIHTGQRSRVFLNYALQYNIREEYDKHRPKNDSIAALNLPEAEYRLNTNAAELIWEHDYIRGLRGKFGVQAQVQENRYFQRFFIPNYNAYTWGIFGIERWMLSHFEFEAGARYDYKHLQSFFYEGNQLLEPIRTFDYGSFNLGGIYKPHSGIRINLNISSGWRAPSVNELYSNGLHHGVGAIERGNKNLLTEKSLSAISTIQYSRKKIDVELSAYTYTFKNFIYYQPTGKPELTIRGAFPVFNYLQNNANISGGDATMLYNVTHWLQLKLTGMVVRGRNTDLKQDLLYMPADRLQFFVQFKPKDRKTVKDIYLEPNLLYVAKQTRVQPNVDYAEPPEAYLLFGLNAGSTFVWHKQVLIVNFAIVNAANTIYRDYLDRFRYYNDALGVNYTLRIRIPFTLYDKK